MDTRVGDVGMKVRKGQSGHVAIGPHEDEVATGDIDIMDLYPSEAGRIPLLGGGEELELAVCWRRGQEAEEELRENGQRTAEEREQLLAKATESRGARDGAPSTPVYEPWLHSSMKCTGPSSLRSLLLRRGPPRSQGIRGSPPGRPWLG